MGNWIQEGEADLFELPCKSLTELRLNPKGQSMIHFSIKLILDSFRIRSLSLHVLCSTPEHTLYIIVLFSREQKDAKRQV